MPKTEVRSSVLRQPTAASELAQLHPVERFLYRLFERLSSIKLAVCLMVWLMIECTVGTFIESQVSTAAAKYFVYGSFRFMLLLALLALNILCAALIRFPWKRYQTGFVVTHAGMLTLLAGSMMTAMNNLDTLMQVPVGETNNKLLDPDREQITVAIHDKDGEVSKETFPVQFGPFHWGHRVFRGWPWQFTWRKDHVEELHLKSGDVLRIKSFYVHCDAEQVYVADDNGQPAMHYRIYHPDRADMSQWIGVESFRGVGRQSMGPGEVSLFRLSSPEELDHFVNAPAQKASAGLIGSLAYSHAGKHYHFSVESLQKGPVAVPNTNVTLEVIEYLPDAIFDKEANKLVNRGEIPNNPTLRIRVVQDGQELPIYMAFGSFPEFDLLQYSQRGTEHLLTFFPADQPSIAQVAVTPEGKAGYRAFGNQGLIASTLVEEGKEYPCWAGLNFVPRKVLASARADLKLRPARFKSGDSLAPGILVELESKDGKKALASMVRDLEGGRPRRLLAGDRLALVEYGIAGRTLPFEIRLDSFEEPKNPGTTQAAMYTSKVTLIDKARDVRKEQVITMNYPLYYKGSDGIRYTFYQSGIDRSTGVAVSTYTVGNDPGLIVKYAGAVVMCTGIFLMFYMGGYFKKSRGKRGGRVVQQARETEAQTVDEVFAER